MINTIIYDAKGMPQKALEYHRKYFESFKEFTTWQNNEHITEMEVRYDSEKKEQELLQLTQQNEIQELRNSRVLLVSILLLISVISAALAIVFFYQKRAHRQKELAAVNKQQLLRSQMNPHFLFNALASVQDYIMEKKPIEAVKFLARFGELVRDILEGSRQEEISLAKEIKMVENFFELEKLRSEKEIQLRIELEGIDDPEDLLIPPMFIQPFVENAIKHGFIGLDKGTIIISITKQVELLQVNILDDGIGYTSSEADKKEKSLAIQITKERLASLNRRPINQVLFEIKDQFTNDQANKGTSVTFNLPVIKLT
ncbi:MAG: histidine kinase [Ekhidna sp.]